jgi:uncharacterized protein YecT (DUF1311 family)
MRVPVPVRSIGRVTLAALITAALAAAASASASVALAPPVIREPWTLLACPAHPVSTIAIEGCLERAVSRSDRIIDQKAATVFRLIKRENDRAAFVSGEQSWLSYRRHSCTGVASVYRGGTAEPIAFLSCEKRLNARHIVDLAAAAQAFRHR